MPYSLTEQELYDFARGSIPRWFFTRARSEEELGAFVKIFDAAKLQIVAYFDQTLILQATNVPPDYLDQHARDRGTARQDGETDASLRQRLRTVEDAVTRPILLAVANAMIDAFPVVGDAFMLELRRDRAFFGKFTDRAGTGGTFATVSGTTRKFTPTVPFPRPIEFGVPRSGSQGNPRLIISSAGAPGNNGTFALTNVDDDAAVYVNATGVNGADPTVAWAIRHYDIDGNPRSSSTGLSRAFISRGYRGWPSAGAALHIILPFGTSATQAAAVEEAIRTRKAAGVRLVVERRLVP